VGDAFRAGDHLALMTVFRNENRWDRSNVVFEGGRILSYDKKNRAPAMKHIDYGLGVLRAAALQGYPAHEPLDLAVVYQDLLARGELGAFEATSRFYEIGTPEGLAETRARFAQPAEGGR
jgi:hypothetical protein